MRSQNPPILHFTALLVFAAMLTTACSLIAASDTDVVTPWVENDGELLYNGIRLPRKWPPRSSNPKSLKPMDAPYLAYPPKVIPIRVGRQLFVDDFLIEATDLKRAFHEAQKHEGNPVLTPAETDGKGKTRQCRLQTGGVFYDPAERVFKMFYDAGWEGGLALATSTDLLHWDRPELGIAGGNLLLGPGFKDNKACDKGQFPKLTELKLGFSRDGFHWQRPDRRAFIAATRKEGDWDRAYLHSTAGVCLVADDKLWFPYAGFSGIAPDGTHGSYFGASIGMATLRRDGFASMDAGEKPGLLTTRPVVFDGKKLFVNLDAPQGELRVEILDEQNQIIAPFSDENCEPITGDKTKQPVRWKNGGDLSALAGKPVKFRFHLTNGKLYAFWVSPDDSGASHGYVGAGGPEFNGILNK